MDCCHTRFYIAVSFVKHSAPVLWLPSNCNLLWIIKNGARVRAAYGALPLYLTDALFCLARKRIFNSDYGLVRVTVHIVNWTQLRISGFYSWIPVRVVLCYWGGTNTNRCNNCGEEVYCPLGWITVFPRKWVEISEKHVDSNFSIEISRTRYICSSETSIYFQRTKWRYVPQHNTTLNTHR